VKRSAVILLFCAAVLLAFFAMPNRRSIAKNSPTGSLTVYCAAGLKNPVTAIADQYRREFGVEVNLQFGGTSTLLSQIRVSHRGDLFIAADELAVEDARKLGLIREVIPLVHQHPVVAVASGNPKKIHGLSDLLRDDVRVALANPEAASIGRVSKAALGTNYNALAEHATVNKPTVTEIASDLKLGSVDAAIIWDSIVKQFGLSAVEVPELSARTENASVTVVNASTQPTAALRFARYLAAPDKGGEIFKKNNFTPAGGDRWTVRPELILYSGGVNRLSIEGLLQEFSDREGATVTTVFNGCGVLCASMKAMTNASDPKFPDAYFACDICFVPPVAKFFPEAVILTETEIGVAVKKGNPQKILTLADLGKPGLRVGLCNAEQSTLGYMTRGILRSENLDQAVRSNVVVEVPTADFLINQMRAGALDAALVYRVNAAPQNEFIEFFSLDHPGAKALQPFSIRADTPNQQLAHRLLDFLRSNSKRFELAGFRWRSDQPVLKSKNIEVPAWLRDSAENSSTTNEH
jgi:molybdate transport system substrate-binding protein